MIPFLASASATSSTDAGLSLNGTVIPDSGLWGLTEDGTVNEALMLNLGYRSIHDMAVVSKDMVEQFYGKKQEYAYWTGCSQGGRQGYAAAAKYPEDFDGILAVSPAVGFDYAGPATLWPIVVMENEGEVVPDCILNEFQAAILDICDGLDGITDGMISDYDVLTSCSGKFNALTLIGRSITCAAAHNQTMAITPRHANTVTKILSGPRTANGKQYWLGLSPGAPFSGVANTTYNNLTNTWTPHPFLPAAGWLANTILPTLASTPNNSSNMNISLSSMSYDQYFTAFDKSIELAEAYWGDGYLDLTAFQSAGGKLLSWVGTADQYLPPTHVLNFRDTVAEKLSKSQSNSSAFANIDDFYRVFIAPGVGHCSGGVGPQPVGVMETLMKWVEGGIAPETLNASGINQAGENIATNLCPYPQKMVSAKDGKFECRRQTKKDTRDVIYFTEDQCLDHNDAKTKDLPNTGNGSGLTLDFIINLWILIAWAIGLGVTFGVAARLVW